MRNETQQWIEYAEQDYQSAHILLQSHLSNPCLYHNEPEEQDDGEQVEEIDSNNPTI